MTFMDDSSIEAAKSQRCPCCPAGIGQECEDPRSGLPLLEVAGRPIHIKRLEP
jgi:hypothetical protein